MLDKTIPFTDIIMLLREPGHFEISLPDGYTLDTYRDGDDLAWGKMQHEVAGECDSAKDAVQYFRDNYLAYKEKLLERFVAIRNSKGEGVSSCMAWYADTPGGRVSMLQWLITADGYDGLGLAKAAVEQTVNIYNEHNEKNILLHTQPWSYIAIWLYHKSGFRLCRNAALGKRVSQIDESIPILEKLVPKEKMDILKQGITTLEA